MKLEDLYKVKQLITKDKHWEFPGRPMVTAKDLGSVPGVAKTNKNSKDKHCMIPLTTGTWNSQINRDRRQNGGSQELRRERKEGFVFDEYSFSLGK